MTNPDLNDSLDDLIGARSDIARDPIPSRPAPASFTPDRAFVEGCTRCRGTGRTPWGTCFKCDGAGKKTFKTSPQTRQAARQGRVTRQANQAEQTWLDFAAAQPAIAQWILANPNFSFAVSMKQAVERFGSLTENQLAACQRGVDRELAKATERAERAQSAPQVDTAGIDRLKAAFDSARAYSASKAKGLTLRNPKITIGGLTISPAKATSANPGALYVKAGQDYLGKIVDGKLMAVAACSPAQREQILKFVADPADAAKVYGQETGLCCVCNATLTSEWRLRGIGPICAEKMGWE